MKVSVLTGNLQKKLSFVNHAISSRVQLPILSNFLLETREDSLVISATDLEIGIETIVPVQVEEKGSTTVPAKLFTELINALPEEKITLTVKEGSLTIQSKKTNSVLQTMSREEFPSLYEEKGERIIEINPEAFRHDLSMVAFAASIETTRPALSGVLIKKEDNSLLFVATDGYRLSLKKDQSQGIVESDKTILVPVRVIKEVLGLKENSSISLYVSSQSNQIIFEQDETVLVGRLIEAQYPTYQKIIPTDFSAKIAFDREELLKAVKTCSIFARETANIVTLSLQKEKIIVSAKTPSLGENTVEVEAKLEGEENEIAFNVRYLLDVLGNVSENELTFEMTGPLNPGVFKIANNDSFLHLIMPIRT
ncbi:MAG TPA: DNA polymerase III subunit beta [Patescibacteria group bacterium]